MSGDVVLTEQSDVEEREHTVREKQVKKDMKKLMVKKSEVKRETKGR